MSRNCRCELGWKPGVDMPVVANSVLSGRMFRIIAALPPSRCKAATVAKKQHWQTGRRMAFSGRPFPTIRSGFSLTGDLPSTMEITQRAIDRDPIERWSLDDIKDVCEAVHFVAISLGIGAGLYWFCRRYLPRDSALRIEFNVDATVGSEHDSCRLIEVVGLVNNLSHSPVRLIDCRFTLAAVTPAGGSLSVGPVAPLATLVAGEWIASRTVLDAGTCHRLTCPAAIPRNVMHVIVSGSLKHEGRVDPYTASRLVSVKPKLP